MSNKIKTPCATNKKRVRRLQKKEKTPNLLIERTIKKGVIEMYSEEDFIIAVFCLIDDLLKNLR
jgi:hypothetical protein